MASRTVRGWAANAVAMGLLALAGSGCALAPQRVRGPVPSREVALGRALGWLKEHPASLDDGGLLELGEEAILYGVLHSVANSEAERARWRGRIGKVLAAVRRRGTPAPSTPGEATTCIGMAWAADLAGLDAADLRELVENGLLHNPLAYPPKPTTVLLNGVLLRDLGYCPAIAPEDAWPRGVIATMAADPSLNPARMGYPSTLGLFTFFYDVTHEVLALADMGRADPRRRLSPRELEMARRLLAEGVDLCLRTRDVDLVGELMICAEYLRWPGLPRVQEAWDLVLSSQRPEGHFGRMQRLRVMPGRNPYRHSVLVAAWALAVCERPGGQKP